MARLTWVGPLCPSDLPTDLGAQGLVSDCATGVWDPLVMHRGAEEPIDIRSKPIEYR